MREKGFGEMAVEPFNSSNYVTIFIFRRKKFLKEKVFADIVGVFPSEKVKN